jgi:hypothetical protein
MIFSKLLDEKTLLEKVQGYKSLLIVGCRTCANLSVAYEGDLPAYRKTIDPKTDEAQYEPVAIIEEAHRLKSLFESHGFTIDFELFRPPCLQSYDMSIPDNLGGGENASPDFAERYTKYDVVISLACASGTLGLRKRLGKNVKVIPGMVTRGMGQFDFKFDDTKEYVYVDKQATTIIPFGSQT